jgi:uncharacterized protein (UPF0548 family)
MSGRPSIGRRLAIAASWPVGVSLTAWHYMWRTTPLHRRQHSGREPDDLGPPLPPGVSRRDLQAADDGVGPLFHRRYVARIANPALGAEELVARITSDPNRAAPTQFARFVRARGARGEMRVGDEYVVRMPGPWNGPVRVVATTARSFRLATLQGHLEAGEIEFRAADDRGDVVFTIESWARSGDRLSRLLYQNLRMAKEVQLHMWTSFLERVARLAGGRLRGGIDIETRRVDEIGGATPQPLGDAATKRMLDALHDKPLNFDLGDRGQFTPARGWNVDEYCQALPPEAPGDPVAGGSWEVARELMRNYEFADPAIVRAVYYPDRPLADRDMLLEVRFHGLRFRFGVRVGGVRDEVRDVDGRTVRVWGWNYRTLAGHLEKGQMDYEVWKWPDTGAVEFHTCRFSRRAAAGNPLVRLGVWVFGRHEQVKFARRACDRMARLTRAALEAGDAGAADVARVADEVRAGPATANRGRVSSPTA